MMVAIGYVTIDGTNYVTVNDPWPPNQGNQWVNTYDWYVASAGDHTHWNDYYDIAPKGHSIEVNRQVRSSLVVANRKVGVGLRH